MELYCPNCKTELIVRNQQCTCPRHQIGECTYEPFDLNEVYDIPPYKQKAAALEQEAAF